MPKPINYKYEVSERVLEALINNLHKSATKNLSQIEEKLVVQAWRIANKMDAEADKQQ